MPLPSINVLPLIPVTMDPLQQPEPQVRELTALPNADPVASKLQKESELVSGNQVMVIGHNHNKMVKREAQLDYKNTPQYQEFMKQKMLEMKAVRNRQVGLGKLHNLTSSIIFSP